MGFAVAWEVKAPTTSEATPLISMAWEVAASRTRAERVEVCILEWNTLKLGNNKEAIVKG